MPSHAIKNRLTMPSPFLLLSYFAVSLLNMAVVSSTSPFLTNTLGREWKLVGSLNMTDPSKLCPDSWQSFTSPRSCGKKTTAPCDSLSIPTFGFRYQKVCGRFRGYQFGSPDAFFRVSSPLRVEDGYVDGVSITYGSPGKRQHVYTYAAGIFETWDRAICPCTGGGASPPSFVGSDYYCESGNPNAPWSPVWYSSDVLWDGQQCGGNEGTCCSPPDLPWFCKTFPTPISEDLEVRICTDQNLNDENVAIESFELYIQEVVNIQATSVLNPDNTLRQLEISWIPVGGNVTTYTVRVVGADGSVGQGYTVCTTSPCLYLHQVTHEAVYYNISVTSINPDGTLGSQNSTTFMCCSSDQSVPPDSSVYNLSNTKGAKVIVSLQGLTIGQIYYCKAAATNTKSTHCTGPVVGGVKMYFSFVASLSPTTFPTTSNVASIDTNIIIGITIVISFVVFFSLGVLVTTCICFMMKTMSKVTLHHPTLVEALVYEMIETDQKKIKAIELEVNSAYGTAK